MKLSRFVELHASTHDPSDRDEIPAFRRNITATKRTLVYGMHSYHQGKKPHDAIREYVRHYTSPGQLVLDPFCGSGGTVLAALMEGRAAIGLDRSPAAVFIARNHCTAADPIEFERSLARIVSDAEAELNWLYETRCDRCDGPARTHATVFSERFQCPRCESIVPLFDCPADRGRTAAGKPKKIAVCPHCRGEGHSIEISTRGRRFGAMPVLARYRCMSGCEPALSERRHDDPDAKKRDCFERFDLGKIREIESREIPYPVPEAHFPQTFDRWKSDLRPAGIERVADLYTKRNLWALALLRAKALQSHDPDSSCADRALFALTAISLAASKMQRYSPNSGFPNMLLVGTYYVPPIRREIDVGAWYLGKLRAMAKGFAAIGREVAAETPRFVAMSDARSMPIPSDSIDYIFTDPPYADAVQYGELNFVWESWLGGVPDWHDDEIVVNPSRGKTDADWIGSMERAIAECFRVLKPGRWLSLCYHDTSEQRWAMLQNAMSRAGFAIDADFGASSIETNQKSFNQQMSDKSTKRDLVVNFRKPRARISGFKPCATGIELRATGSASNDERLATPDVPIEFNHLGRRIIREYLEIHPGATKDRIYDDLVGRLLSRGRMQAHDFNALLRTVAEERTKPRRGKTKRPPASGKWYLSGQVDP